MVSVCLYGLQPRFGFCGIQYIRVGFRTESTFIYNHSGKIEFRTLPSSLKLAFDLTIFSVINLSLLHVELEVALPKTLR